MSIDTALLVRIEVAEYRDGPGQAPREETLLFSDMNRVFSAPDGNTYTGLGHLLNITSSRSELVTSGYSMSIGLAGVPNTALQSVYASSLRGSKITVARVFLDPETYLAIGDDVSYRFSGRIMNYAITETFDYEARSSSNIVTLECGNVVDILANTVAGRRTNPIDNRRYFPGDSGMDRVPTIENQSFDFGVK